MNLHGTKLTLTLAEFQMCPSNTYITSGKQLMKEEPTIQGNIYHVRSIVPCLDVPFYNKFLYKRSEAVLSSLVVLVLIKLEPLKSHCGRLSSSGD